MIFGLVSCNGGNGDTDPVVEAIVTIKSAADNSCYMQLNNKVKLRPTNENFRTNPYGKDIRAHVVYSDRGVINEAGGDEWRAVDLAMVDTILTKKPVKPVKDYGTDAIEIVDNWATCLEDGYLTIYFEGLWGSSGKSHIINLVETDAPLTFMLKHDNAGDIGTIRMRGLIAFDLHDVPMPNEAEFDVVVVYQGYEAMEQMTFHYKDGVFVIK